MNVGVPCHTPGCDNETINPSDTLCAVCERKLARACSVAEELETLTRRERVRRWWRGMLYDLRLLDRI